MRLENYLTDFTFQSKVDKIIKNLRERNAKLAQKSIQTENNSDPNRHGQEA